MAKKSENTGGKLVTVSVVGLSGKSSQFNYSTLTLPVLTWVIYKPCSNHLFFPGTNKVTFLII